MMSSFFRCFFAILELYFYKCSNKMWDGGMADNIWTDKIRKFYMPTSPKLHSPPDSAFPYKYNAQKTADPGRYYFGE